MFCGNKNSKKINMFFIRTKNNILPSKQLIKHEVSCYEFDLIFSRFIEDIRKLNLNPDDLLFETLKIKPKYKQIIVSDCIIYKNLEIKDGLHLISRLFNYKLNNCFKIIENKDK